MLWASAVRDPCPGSVWSGQPLWARKEACLRVRERVPCRALPGVDCRVHLVRPLRGQISGALSTQTMIFSALDTSDV